MFEFTCLALFVGSLIVPLTGAKVPNFDALVSYGSGPLTVETTVTDDGTRLHVAVLNERDTSIFLNKVVCRPVGSIEGDSSTAKIRVQTNFNPADSEEYVAHITPSRAHFRCDQDAA
jgi:hypothetical protein